MDFSSEGTDSLCIALHACITTIQCPMSYIKCKSVDAYRKLVCIHAFKIFSLVLKLHAFSTKFVWMVCVRHSNYSIFSKAQLDFILISCRTLGRKIYGYWIKYAHTICSKFSISRQFTIGYSKMNFHTYTGAKIS